MIECPYCEKNEDDPDDCHDSSTTYFTECSHCGKEYSFSLEYEVRYYPSTIPCNDGELHKWKFQYNWNDDDHYYCQYCAKEDVRKKTHNEPID